MPIKFQKWITRADLKTNPDTLYVFGDNLLRKGMGGQAKEMRGEPNAIGIATKVTAAQYASDVNLLRFLESWLPQFKHLQNVLLAGGTVVWPAAGIGTGLADLKAKAPQVDAALTVLLDNLLTEFVNFNETNN